MRLKLCKLCMLKVIPPSAIACMGVAVAVNASPDVPSSTGQVQTLDEIQVSAERRRQSLQHVPIAATVINADDIAARGIHGVHDMMQLAPSLSINQVNRSTYINIRGVGIAQTAPTSSPGVAWYVDGQLIPQEQSIAQGVYDVETIEILRGPQGTLSGQNSTGGAVYIRTPDPFTASSDVSGYLVQSLGDYDWSKSEGAVNAAINENLAFRVAAAREKRDSFTSNLGSSRSNPGNVDYYGARVNLAFKGLEERLRVNVRGEYYHSDNDNNAVKPWQDTINRNPYAIAEDARSFLRQKGTRISAELNHAVSDAMTLRWLGSWQDGRTTDQTDGDRSDTALPRPGVGRVGFTDTSLKNNIHEINLISTGAGPVDWVLGGFLLDGRVDVTVLRDNDNTADFVNPTSTIMTQMRNNSKSLFAQVNAWVRRDTELVVGMRRSWDHQRYDRLVNPGGVGETRLESSQTTGKLALNRHLNRQSMWYVSAAKGYKAGGGNLPLAAPAFGPETNHVLEAGLKSTLFERRLRMNLAAFHSNYRNIQLASLADGLPLTQNAASGKAKGVELEVVALLGGFSLNAGGGWLQAEFAEDVWLQNTLSNRNEMVAAGGVLPFSPKITFNAGIEYEIEMRTVQLTPRLQWHHVSQSYATPFPSARTEISSRHVVDARIRLRHGEHLTVDGFVNNVFKRLYSTMQLMNSSSADGGTLYGAPRHVGVRIRYDFY